jgi:hypothetical protein
MEPSQVKAAFLSAVDEYFNGLLKAIDAINPASKARAQVEELFATMRSAVEECSPTILHRDVHKPEYRLITSGTELDYRIVELMQGGARELAALLALDAARLPPSVLPAIDAHIRGVPEVELEVVRIVFFVTMRGDKNVPQPIMLLAAKDASGELHPIPFLFRWSVSGFAVGGDDIADRIEGEADRLSFLMHVIMNADGATLHNERQEVKKRPN